MAGTTSTSGHRGMHEVTQLLNAIDNSDAHAAEQLQRDLLAHQEAGFMTALQQIVKE